MSTLMEKDALIERVASIQALIARKTTRNGGEHTPDQKRIAELRQYLYFTESDDISFKDVKDECNALYQKYTTMPKSGVNAGVNA